MAYDFKQGAQYLSDLMMGLGTGLMSAPRGGPPLAGFSSGINNANNLMQMRRQQAQDDLRNQMVQQQFQQQQDAIAEQKRKEAAAKTWLIGQKPPTNVGQGMRSTGPTMPGAISSLPANAQAAITGFADIDPLGAAQTASNIMLNPPKPDAPVVKDFYEGGNVVQKQWDPSTNTWNEVGRGARFAPVQAPQLPPDIVKYQYDMNQRKGAGQPTIPYSEWSKAQSGGDLRYGLNPIYAKGPDGQMHLVLPNDQGGIKVVDLPAGYVLAPQTQMVNTGTAQVPIDKRTGEQVAGAEALPIDNQGKAQQTDLGKAVSQAQQALPALNDAVSNATAQIAEIKNDPALDWATGWTGGLLQKVPGSSWKSLATRIEQLKGTSFMQARQLLKGGGTITDYEGAQADRALNRLDTAQNSKDFIQALDEFQTAINQGLARMQFAAQGNFEQSGSEQFPMQTAPAPAAGAAPNIPPPPPGFEVVK